jgi:plasmid maintenance system killer protein
MNAAKGMASRHWTDLSLSGLRYTYDPLFSRRRDGKDLAAGIYSIRIDDQYRVCFAWQDGDALNVEITDYH